jgi:hypothetical protein
MGIASIASAIAAARWGVIVDMLLRIELGRKNK